MATPYDAGAGDQRPDLDAGRSQHHHAGDANDEDAKDVADDRKQRLEARRVAGILGRLAAGEAHRDLSLDERLDDVPEEIGDEHDDDHADEAANDAGGQRVHHGQRHEIDVEDAPQKQRRDDEDHPAHALLEDDDVERLCFGCRHLQPRRPQDVVHRAARRHDRQGQRGGEKGEPEDLRRPRSPTASKGPA